MTTQCHPMDFKMLAVTFLKRVIKKISLYLTDFQCRLCFPDFNATRVFVCCKCCIEYLTFEKYLAICLLMEKKAFRNEYLQSNRLQITCCSMTTLAMAAWTTLVRSRQSIQLTRKIPSCLHITPASSTLFKNNTELFYNIK